MLIAKITHDSPVQGFVINADDMMIAVQCKRTTDGVWNPLFAIKRGDRAGRMELPACFTLDDTAAAALELAYQDYQGDNDGD